MFTTRLLVRTCFFFSVRTSVVGEKLSRKVYLCETDSKPTRYFLISHAGVLLPPIVLSWNSWNWPLTKRSTRLDFPTADSPSSTSLNWQILLLAAFGPLGLVAPPLPAMTQSPVACSGLELDLFNAEEKKGGGGGAGDHNDGVTALTHVGSMTFCNLSTGSLAVLYLIDMNPVLRLHTFSYFVSHNAACLHPSLSLQNLIYNRDVIH